MQKKRVISLVPCGIETEGNYPPVVQVLERLLAGAFPDLHLPGLGDVALPVDDSAAGGAPSSARRQRVKVQRLRLGGTLHRAEHAAEFLPGPVGAVGTHAVEKRWHFPSG